MTREEVIAALLADKEMPYLQDWQARDIVDFVIKNYAPDAWLKQPSLPSNLDEASKRYGFEEYRRRCEDGEYGTSEDAFKDGVEWIAGQGISMEVTDDTEWEEVDSFVHKNLEGGDILQIRKK